MIMVDIRILSIDKIYDFNLDEDTAIEVLIEEIIEMVLQKEKTLLTGKIGDLYICSDRGILPRKLSLRACNIKTGDFLFMV